MENSKQENIKINSQERLKLKELIQNSDCQDNTESIRQLKHSSLIFQDIQKINQIKQHETNIDKIIEEATIQCSFLYNQYTDIFHKVIKDEMDLSIMERMLNVLKMIEDEKIDQHEGSVVIGRILKELYLDSAVRTADNISKKYNSVVESKKIPMIEEKNIDWKEYKKKLL